MRSPFFAPFEYRDGTLILRGYRPDDAAALQEATVSSYEHLRTFMPWATLDQTVEDAEILCRRFAANYLLNHDFCISIWLKGEYAGGSGFHLRCGPLESGCAEIGMWIRGSLANQGIATRALNGMLEWGFEEWGWERLVWKCDTRNLASARVAEKCGMVLEGTFRSDAIGVDGERRDTFQYAKLRGE